MYLQRPSHPPLHQAPSPGANSPSESQAETFLNETNAETKTEMSLGRKEASEQAISEDRRGHVEARATEALGKLMAEVEPCLQGSEQSASPASWTLVEAGPFAAPCASSRADQTCSLSSPVEAMLIEEAVAELEVLIQER